LIIIEVIWEVGAALPLVAVEEDDGEVVEVVVLVIRYARGFNARHTLSKGYIECS
jgi:predicted DNA-binding antitoxin AbrB/MazE fold protein